MITIFTIPKPFKDNISIIQKNAIKSWQNQYPLSEIILIGDEIGVSEISNEMGIKQIMDIQKNEFGTPLLSDAYNKIQNIAKYDKICYINTDIILIPNKPLEEILQIATDVSKNSFLMVGKRINIDVNYSIDFSINTWRDNLLSTVSSYGKLQPPI